MRTVLPLAQRRPSPNTAPAPPAVTASPWKKRTLAFVALVTSSRTESLDNDGCPADCSRAPTPSECRQPDWSPGALSLPHGQAVLAPSPKHTLRDAWPKRRTLDSTPIASC